MATNQNSVERVDDAVVRSFARAAVLAALMGAAAVVGSIPIPFSPVPVSLGVLVVYLMGLYLGPVWGPASVGLYLTAGASGSRCSPTARAASGFWSATPRDTSGRTRSPHWLSGPHPRSRASREPRGNIDSGSRRGVAHGAHHHLRARGDLARIRAQGQHDRSRQSRRRSVYPGRPAQDRRHDRDRQGRSHRSNVIAARREPIR